MENHCQGGDFLQGREVLLSKRISLETLAGLYLEPTKSCLGRQYFDNQGRTVHCIFVQKDAMDGVNQQRTREDNRSQDDQERREEHGHEATATAQAGTAQIHWRKLGLPGSAILHAHRKRPRKGTRQHPQIPPS